MKHDRTGTTSNASRVLLGVLAFAMLAAGGTATAGALKDGRIGYVQTERRWAVYETENGKTECPNGFNGGPREQFAKLFPKDSGNVYTVLESRLMREGRAYHATTSEEPFPFHEAQGPISYGLNLDGKNGPNDFQSPKGVKGIDNQLYRAMGCIRAYRTDGVIWFFATDDMYDNAYNRWMIELTGVDDLTNDDDVTVTTYRGLDELRRDGNGMGFAAGGTQRVDMRWGQSFIEQLQGKIVDGVLTTEPIDQIKIPWSQPGLMSGYYIVRDLSLQLDLTEQTAKGIWAGYVDVAAFDHQLKTNWSTHFQSYGQLSGPSLYRAMRRLADGYPDPETGVNTAISGAAEVAFTQVFLVHPGENTKIVGIDSSR